MILTTSIFTCPVFPPCWAKFKAYLLWKKEVGFIWKSLKNCLWIFIFWKILISLKIFDLDVFIYYLYSLKTKPNTIPATLLCYIFLNRNKKITVTMVLQTTSIPWLFSRFVSPAYKKQEGDQIPYSKVKTLNAGSCNCSICQNLSWFAIAKSIKFKVKVFVTVTFQCIISLNTFKN